MHFCAPCLEKRSFGTLANQKRFPGTVLGTMWTFYTLVPRGTVKKSYWHTSLKVVKIVAWCFVLLTQGWGRLETRPSNFFQGGSSSSRFLVWKPPNPHQKHLGGGFWTPGPLFCLICTIISNKTGHYDWYQNTPQVPAARSVLLTGFDTRWAYCVREQYVTNCERVQYRFLRKWLWTYFEQSLQCWSFAGFRVALSCRRPESQAIFLGA